MEGHLEWQSEGVVTVTYMRRDVGTMSRRGVIATMALKSRDDS